MLNILPETNKQKVPDDDSDINQNTQYTLPSDVKKLYMISGKPTKDYSNHGPLDSDLDTNLWTIPISSFKVKKHPKKPRVQSARRMQSLGSVNPKYSKTQNLLPGYLGDVGNKTMHTLERRTGRSRREVKDHPIGEKYMKYCLLYTSPSPRDGLLSRMPSSA